MWIDPQSQPRHRTFCRVRLRRFAGLGWKLGISRIVGQGGAKEKRSAAHHVRASNLFARLRVDVPLQPPLE